MIARFQWLPADAPKFGWLAPCSPTGVVSPSPDPAVMAAVFGPEGPAGVQGPAGESGVTDPGDSLILAFENGLI